ncbi:MAG: hypothetical protein K6E64_08995 [Lachnospiraceae bacterium]|nr:hypothetical protein [Lachnospiraceae bacterium]
MNKKKVLSLALAAVLAASSAVVALPATGVEAASKVSVDLVTKTTDNAGNTTTYTYDKNGLLTKKVVKYSKTSKNKIAVTADSNSTDITDANGDDIGWIDTYGITGSHTLTTKTDTTTTTKYTYNTSGKAKGQLKKAVTTAEKKETYSDVYSISGDDATKVAEYKANNEGSYVATRKTVTTDTYAYSKANLKKVTSVTKAPSYDTYSKQTGRFAKATKNYNAIAYDSATSTYTYPESTDTMYLNGPSYKNDTTTSTTVSTYTFKKSKPTKVKSQTTTVENNVSLSAQFSDRVYGTDGYSWSRSIVGYDTYSSQNTEVKAATTEKFTFDKKGNLTKRSYTDPGTYTTQSTTTYTSAAGTSTTTTDPAVAHKTDKFASTSKWSYDKNRNLKKESYTSTDSSYNYKTETCTYSTATAPTTYVYGGEFYVDNVTKGTVSYENTLKNGTTTIKARMITSNSVRNGGKNPSKTISKVSNTIKTKKVKSTYKKQVAAQQYKLTNSVNTAASFGL